MYSKNYTTGDEYDSPCEQGGCGFASHSRQCPHYAPQRPEQTREEREAELNTSVTCMGCGRSVLLREVHATGCCHTCTAEMLPVLKIQF